MASVNYTATVWREPEGGWSASADGIDGAFTAGDSLAEIDRNIRESIAVTLDLRRGAEDTMTVELNVRIDADADGLVSETVEARQAAARASELTAKAVRTLRRKGLSVRDVAKVLGVTPGRVTQLDKDKFAA
jgi:predicted RNase H-like HicB family nuclease